MDEIRTRGSKVYQQGEKVTHLYIIKKGEVKQSLKEYQDKPDYMETDTKEIFKQPWQAKSQHSEHMTTNTAKDVINIDLGIAGKMFLLGIIEASQKLPTYRTSCEVVSN